jgi:hypothetical protein
MLGRRAKNQQEVQEGKGNAIPITIDLVSSSLLTRH